MKTLVLISDYGHGSFELAKLKSQLVNAVKGVNLIELSNNIPMGDTVQAAFLLNRNIGFYPADTVFYIAVGLSSKEHDLVMQELDGSFFIAPDNGLLSLALGNNVNQYYSLKSSEAINDAVLDFLQNGLKNNSFEPNNNVERKILPQIQKNERALQAYIQFIDSFGNLYIKISKHELDEWLQGDSFILRLRRDERLQKINTKISEVGSGNAFAVFSDDTEYLIAGNNMGNGSRLMGLKVLDKVIFEKLR